MLSDLHGGTRRNVIPSSGSALLWVRESAMSTVKDRLRESCLKFSQILFPGARADQRGQLSFEQPDAAELLPPIDPEQALRIALGLQAIYHGVVEMSDRVPGLVATSNNFAIVRTSEDNISVLCMARSSKPGGAEEFIAGVAQQASRWGAVVTTTDSYPGWEPEPDSPLHQLTLRAHEEILGKAPAVLDVHAGLECGPLKRVLPDLHMTSFGPDIQGAHSTDECVSIPSVDRVWRVLKRVVEGAVDLTA